MEEEGAGADSSKFLLSHDDPEQAVDPEMQARLEALLQAAGKLLLFIEEIAGVGKKSRSLEYRRQLCISSTYEMF